MYDTLLNNIIGHAENPQYRKISTSKPRLKETIFSSDLSKQLLGLSGWITLDSRLVSSDQEYHNKLPITDLKLIQGDLNLAIAEVIKEKL